MFKHQGKTRTLSHNLKIASLLSFVAGLVNVAGFFAIAKLTTNVTGHFAFFADEIIQQNFGEAFVYFLYIFFFFLGSFVSSILVELTAGISEQYIVPTSIEALVLVLMAWPGGGLIATAPHSIAFSLLFAMGLQNSLVTRISNASVRTTHLTGLFTDLGIELSQLFFYKLKEQRQQLLASLKLRGIIILFFFTGGICGGVLYQQLQLQVLYIAAAALLAGLVYDSVKFKLIMLRRKLYTDKTTGHNPH
jgi:uncharacterized membrane protein YoaK (UPF0700 family)